MKYTIRYVLRIFDVGCVFYFTAAVLAVLLWFSFRNKRITKRVALTVLLPYLFLVAIPTVITRLVKAEQHINLKPLWTIQAIITGGHAKAWLVKEVCPEHFYAHARWIICSCAFQEKENG